jgi:SAM-dependent methyltransferase
MEAIHTFLLILSLILPLALAFSVVRWSLRNGITPLPTSPSQFRVMLDCLNAAPAGTTVMDLGSGFGTLVLRLGHRFPACHIIGIENSPVPYAVSRLLALIFRKSNVRFKRNDFMRENLGRADVVVCYLFPRGMQNLKEKLERELRPGSLVISNTFAVPGWQPQTTIRGLDLYRSMVFVYRIGEISRPGI